MYNAEVRYQRKICIPKVRYEKSDDSFIAWYASDFRDGCCGCCWCFLFQTKKNETLRRTFFNYFKFFSTNQQVLRTRRIHIQLSLRLKVFSIHPISKFLPLFERLKWIICPNTWSSKFYVICGQMILQHYLQSTKFCLIQIEFVWWYKKSWNHLLIWSYQHHLSKNKWILQCRFIDQIVYLFMKLFPY